MVSTELVEHKVKDIVADQLGLADDEIPLDASFTTDLGADDLDLIELMMAFEEEFDLEIDDDTAEELKAVQDVVNYVSERIH